MLYIIRFFIFFSLPRPSICIVLSIEKIDKNTDIKFPKETEDSSQQTTHFVLPQGAFKNMSGIPHIKIIYICIPLIEKKNYILHQNIIILSQDVAMNSLFDGINSVKINFKYD